MIEYNLNLEACTVFDGKIKLNESYFGGICKGKRVLRKRNDTDKKNFHLLLKNVGLGLIMVHPLKS